MQELDFQMLIQRLSRVDPLDPRNAGVVRARLSCWLACLLAAAATPRAAP